MIPLVRVVHGYGDGTRGLCQTVRSKKRDKTMLGLVPLDVDIRLMPQTINMTIVHGFCYMDATSYNEEHQEDFWCIQIPVAL